MTSTTKLIARILLAVLGGYAFSAAASAALAVGLARATGIARGEAVVLAGMLAFIIYLGVLLWAFAARGLGRMALVLGGGTLLGHVVVRWLGPAVQTVASASRAAGLS